MELDAYTSYSADIINLTDKDLQAFEQSNNKLYGGIFIGGGNEGGFRRELYDLWKAGDPAKAF